MYCEIAEGAVTNRNIIIPTGDLHSSIERAQSSIQELYRSLYDYDEEIVEHMTVRKTIRGYRGKYYLPKLIFDVDKGDDTHDAVLNRTLEFIDVLHLAWQVPMAAIAIYYSGTGYHVVIPDVFHFQPGNDLPSTVARTIAKHFANSHIDDIYSNATRLIRVAGTINKKSTLYKIRLSLDELGKGPSFVRQTAMSPRVLVQNAPKADSLPDHSSLAEHAPTMITVDGLSVVQDNTGTTAYVPCMQKLWDRGEKKGSRHNDILRLGSAFRRGGLPRTATESLMIQWASTLEPYAVKAAVHDIYRVPLQYGCEDPIMRNYCSQGCIYHRHKNFVVRTKTTEEVEAEFASYVSAEADLDELNLKQFLELEEDFHLRKGDVVVVLGDTGIGKTAFVQHLCVSNPHLKTLYLSLEMGQHLTFRRLVQSRHGLTKEEVLDHYRANTNTLGTDIRHITITTTSPRLDALTRAVADHQPNLVVIDTLDCIEAPGDMNAKIDDIVLGLVAIASKYKCIILAIHHISKFAAIEQSLSVHSGRGSATLEHKASMVIGLEKLGDATRKVFSLKARDESPFDVLCQFDFNTFRFRRLHTTAEALTWQA